MAPSSKKENRDDPNSPKLPPTNREPDPQGLPKIPTAGVSTRLKTFVIGMTFITIMAFGIFIAMFIKKAFVNEHDSGTWGPQLITIAEELKDRGLKSQAIEHYQKYLDTQKADLETRSRISFNISQLYVGLGKCDDAVAWFLHAKAAQPTSPSVQEPEAQIQQCRSQSKTSQ